MASPLKLFRGKGAARITDKCLLRCCLSALQLWLQQLDNGTPEREGQLPDLAALTEAASETTTTTTSTSSSSGQAPPGLDRPQIKLDELYDLVDINHQVEVEDYAVSTLQQQQQQKQQQHGAAEASPTSGAGEAGVGPTADPSSSSSSSSSRYEVDHKLLVGLWPEAALINHSCSPNVSQLLMQVSSRRRGMPQVFSADLFASVGALVALLLSRMLLTFNFKKLPRARAGISYHMKASGGMVGARCR